MESVKFKFYVRCREWEREGLLRLGDLFIFGGRGGKKGLVGCVKLVI